MALADYDTSAEKISALKAAMMDPALTVYLTTGLDVVLSETIYPVTAQFYLNGLYLYRRYDNSYAIPSALYSGDTIKDFGGLMYIKDSSITYSDPVTTYQNRLAVIMVSQLKISAGWTVGSNAALIKSVRYSQDIIINGDSYVSEGAENTRPHLIPVKAGDVISGSTSTTYIDLPADW